MSYKAVRIGLASAAVAVTAGGFAVLGFGGGENGATSATAKAEGKTYTVNFQPLNAGVTYEGESVPQTGATGMLTVKGNEITVALSVNGVTTSLHPQHIHAGASCPDMSDDMNNDGYVDVIEGLPKYGPIFVNLDSDLSTNDTQLDFPSGSSYHYHETMERSLQDELEDAFKLGRRHIVVHGYAGAVPSTVQTLPGLPASTGNLVLPIACGEIEPAG